MIDTLEITPVRLSDMVAERIASAIMDGTIPAGSRVRDHDLAEQLGVSRMPVREALQRLQRVGLIETAASRYTRVTEVTPDLAEATRQFSGHYSVSLVRMALARMTPDERTDAARAIDEIVSHLERDGSTAVARRDLHALLVALAGNAFMSMMSNDVSMAIQRNLAATTMPLDTVEELAENIRTLRDAVRDGDADAAEQALRAQYGISDE
ncbi:GntR family transcriptional regulator [Microbacterium sp. NPDC096154]|uniref:GntR family transcriptional regulator n=1 Tax=Microbacterium sp. NPDC096154 TaxID=3155549 RepID=UPI003323E895